jgi:hypothetical protein
MSYDTRDDLDIDDNNGDFGPPPGEEPFIHASNASILHDLFIANPESESVDALTPEDITNR